MSTSRVLALAFACSFAAAGTAAADPEVVLDIIHPPRVEATIIGARGATSDLTLRDEVAGTQIRATKVIPYEQGSEPIAIAIVFQGMELFVGNNTFETDEAATYWGVLPMLSDGLDQLEVTRHLPAGSQISLVSYATGAEIKLPLAPVAKLHGALGKQLDYRGKIGSDMVAGIEIGIHELERSHAPVKALIVIGDGNDTNNETAKAALASLKKRAAEDRISTLAVVYKTVVSSETEVISSMIHQVQMVSSAASLAPAVDEFLGRVTDRTYASFDAGALAWDGRTHDLIVRGGGTDLDPVTVVLPGAVAPSTPWWKRWFVQLAGGLALLAAIALAMRVRQARAAAAP